MIDMKAAFADCADFIAVVTVRTGPDKLGVIIRDGMPERLVEHALIDVLTLCGIDATREDVSCWVARVYATHPQTPLELRTRPLTLGITCTSDDPECWAVTFTSGASMMP